MGIVCITIQQIIEIGQIFILSIQLKINVLKKLSDLFVIDWSILGFNLILFQILQVLQPRFIGIQLEFKLNLIKTIVFGSVYFLIDQLAQLRYFISNWTVHSQQFSLNILQLIHFVLIQSQFNWIYFLTVFQFYINAQVPFRYNLFFLICSDNLKKLVILALMTFKWSSMLTYCSDLTSAS